MRTRNRKITLLLAALTKGGKTTIVKSMCLRSVRDKIPNQPSDRTEITVDYIFDSDATDVTLKEIHWHEANLYNWSYSTDIFNKNINEAGFLKDLFHMEEFAEANNYSGLKNYVDEKTAEFIATCNSKLLKRLIGDNNASRLIKRIEVIVPPKPEFKAFIEENDANVVLRDTRGFMDFDPSDATDLPHLSDKDLGIDGIDGVILLGSTSPFPNNLNKLYKKSYEQAFISVPVFTMSCMEKESDSESDIACVAHLQCYRLLSKFGVGKIYNEGYYAYDFQKEFEKDELEYERSKFGEDNVFKFEYKIENNRNLRYIYPLSPTLAKLTDAEPNYDIPDVAAYEAKITENLSCICSQTLDYLELYDRAITQHKASYLQYLLDKPRFDMKPEYRKYARDDVNASILNGTLLGERGGITSVDPCKNELKCLGSLTTAITATYWMHQCLSESKFAPEGKLIKDNLVKKALNKLIRDNNDIAKHDYWPFVERETVIEAIENLRANNQMTEDSDVLTAAVKETMKLVLQ